MIIFISIMLILLGTRGGGPSPLDEKPNTATLVFLAGIICLVISLK